MGLLPFLYYPKQTSDGLLSPTMVTTSGNVTEATVMGLLPFTNYGCYVTANTSVGGGPPSPIQTQRTVESGECVLHMYMIISELAIIKNSNPRCTCVPRQRDLMLMTLTE